VASTCDNHVGAAVAATVPTMLVSAAAISAAISAAVSVPEILMTELPLTRSPRPTTT
jgi:hypothetical protein